jgi:hypothetical protein
MTDARMNRRLGAMLSLRLEDAGLDDVPDPRDRRGIRWSLGTLLRAVVVGVAAGAESLAKVEKLTTSMSPAMQRKLQIPRRVPDTTLRDALCAIEPAELGPCLRSLTRAAYRSKSLTPYGLPFGVASMDGKGTALSAVDDRYAQRQTQGEEGRLVGVVRTVTVTLTSSQARPCIDVTAIPAKTNEMGTFREALEHLVRAYAGLDLFRVVTYDAGACSLDNATAVREHHLHYVFGLTAAQPTLFEAAKVWLGVLAPDKADAVTTDQHSGNTVVRRLYVGAAVEVDSPEGWEAHLRTVLRVETETLDKKGNRIKVENRYLISSLAHDRLEPDQWLLLLRRHWGVETTHQILDVALQEDDHPWIEQNPRGMLVVAILRRIAYTLLSLFRSVTQRSDLRRAVPWKDLLWAVHVALLTTTAEQLHGLRPRARAASP